MRGARRAIREHESNHLRSEETIRMATELTHATEVPDDFGGSSTTPEPNLREGAVSKRGWFRESGARWRGRLALVAVGGLGLWVAVASLGREDTGSVEVTDIVRRGTLSVIVTAGGELQSSKSVDVVCEAEGQQIKIVEMLPEGTPVKAGQVVMKFDTADLRKALVESQIKVMRAQTALKTAQEELKIQANKGASVIAQAKLVHTLAELDRNKYEQGDYSVLVNDLNGLIALAKTDLEEAMTTFEHYKKLVKQGFRTPEQLRAKEEAVMRARYFLSRDTAKLQVLEKFTRERQMTELKAKAAEAKREMGRAQSSSAALSTKANNDLKAAEVALALEEQTQKNLQLQLDRFTVKAPQDGVVVYATGTTNDNRIRPGAVVHHKQKLFSLPDMSKMQVRAFVHESAIGKVKPGLKVDVRIDAHSQEVLPGVVTHVSTFYDPEREWLAGGVKEYATDIEIERLPGAVLKPGMTAEVRIMVREIRDRLLVPMPAVTEVGGKYCTFVRGENGFERRLVEVGDNNDRFVEIADGLREGEEVALDVRTRTAADSQ